MSMFNLLAQRRFGPFFGVQFLGALNDNLFKNTMVIMIAFRAATEAESGMLINLAAGLFILPFFLFSAVAGQISDKFEKSRIMRIIKTAEIGIMGIGAVGFYTGHTALLFITLFLMGTHSAFFGPAKYSILPQHLRENELTTGNALVEMGTFLAILIGTLAGGLLAGKQNLVAISGSILGVAMAGYLISTKIPLAPAMAPGLKLNWNPFSETMALTRIIRARQAVFNSILGISWFWFFGATLLAQLPNFTKHMLHGNESVVTLFLAVFSVSVGIGSVVCAKLSRGDIELGLVPLGALGMTLFLADLSFISYPPASEALLGVRALFNGAHAHAAWRAMIDLGMVGAFGSLFIVPLYALIQSRSDEGERSRVIAANNIFNAVFMVASALITMVLFKIGFNTVEILLFTAILNLVVCAYIFMLIPEFVMRFAVWILASTIYRLRYAGRDSVPRNGPAVIVCNHVSFIDWFIITAACRRPVHFVMDNSMFRNPLLGWLFRLSRAIPIAPAKEDAAVKERAFELISKELRDDNLVCIFPEGKITYDGAMNPFRPGVERILARDAVPVIPMAIDGLWGSFFSRKGGKAMASLPKPSRRSVSVAIGDAMPASSKAEEMEVKVRRLLGQAASEGDSRSASPAAATTTGA
ncbi:MAG: putative acyltransferase family protein [Fibrobacteres bacterium]|nr:putative acyltransferase family protein [Fibrobacterota bacterium]